MIRRLIMVQRYDPLGEQSKKFPLNLVKIFAIVIYIYLLIIGLSSISIFSLRVTFTYYCTRKLAQKEGFNFCRVSGLEGFEECIHSLQSTANFIAVSDIAQGYTELNTTPHTRRVKTVFFAMRHALDDMEARQECMDIMRELFRQFMSILIQEKTRVEEENIYLDPRISFQEIDRYFLSGCACAFFQVATDVYTDLRYNQEE